MASAADDEPSAAVDDDSMQTDDINALDEDNGASIDDDDAPDDLGPSGAGTPDPSQVTWHEHIAPLMHASCVGCHQANGIAPFSLENYEQAQPFAELALQAVQERRMPPWGAQSTNECEPRFDWKNDLRLSKSDLALLEAWVKGGAQEGDSASAEPLPAPLELELKDRDLRLAIAGEVSVSGTTDSFKCFSLNPQLAEDAWLVASQVNPGNNAIVHHVLVYLDTSGESAELGGEDGSYDCFGGPQLSNTELVAAWAPGGVPQVMPDDVGLLIPAGARLVLNVHYHPTGAGEERDDSTSVDLKFAEVPPAYAASMTLIGNFSKPNALGGLLPGPNDPDEGPAFLIPAGAKSHVERMSFLLPASVPETIVWSVGTHMHYVGTDMLMTVARSTTNGQPAEECLLQTPAWDFNWQRAYQYDADLSELPRVRAGDLLSFRCTYDNSLDNPFVREALDEQGLTAPRDVALGDESLDEMCLGVFGAAVPR